MTLSRSCMVLLMLAGMTLLAVGPSPAEPGPEPDPLRLQPGDKVKVTVVGYEDLDGEYLVDREGQANLPLVGEVTVVGLTGREAERRLAEAFRSCFRAAPQVMVEGRYRVSVLGQVKRPGMFHINGTEKLTDLLALAGGETDLASLGGARLTRDGTVIKRNLNHSLSQGESVADIGVRSGDTLYIPRKRMVWDWRTWTTIISSVYLIVMINENLTN